MTAERKTGRTTRRTASQTTKIPRLRRGLHLVGGSLSLLALGWIGWKMSSHVDGLRQAMTPRLGAALGLAALAYTLLGGVLAVAWWWLCRLHGDRPALVPAVAVWSRSQFAKYLPTNVFHFVSRQLLGRRLGLRHETLVAGHLLETVSLFLAAGLLVGLSLVASPGDGTGDGTGHAERLLDNASSGRWLAVLALAAAALLAWPLFDRLVRRLPWIGPRLAPLPHLGWRDISRTMAPVLALHVVFFVGTAGLLQVIDSAWHGGGLPWPQTVWIYALAWSLGTVTPGAPGGLGVREAALTFGLAELAGVPSAQAAGIALALRVVTVLGDLVLYLVALRIPIADVAEAPE